MLVWAIILLVFYLYFFCFNHQFEENVTEINESECPIEYGAMKCLEGRPTIGFYNSNRIKLENIRLYVPSDSGVDIYMAQDPLEPESLEFLTLSNASCSVNQSDINVSWCCGNCFEVSMANPSEDIVIE